ncbi:DNA damage-inducible protein D [Anaerosporobacter sp.]
MLNFEKELKEFENRVLPANATEEERNNYTESFFESIKHINESGQEFWYARELQTALEYKEWRNFCNVIDKAKLTCESSNYSTSDHFVDTNKIVEAGVTLKQINDIMLSRYACYIIVMNADPSKEIVAIGKTYFAIKTRQQELIDDYDNLNDDQKRLAIRQEMKEHNKSLADAAHNAGVIEPIDYAIFTNSGYQGLYGGLTKKDIHVRKKLKKSQDILDYMGHEELAANLFRATQTESKLRRENIIGKEKANNAHYDVGKEVRDTIQRLGGTMPEDLPTPGKSIKQIEREQNKLTQR